MTLPLPKTVTEKRYKVKERTDDMGMLVFGYRVVAEWYVLKARLFSRRCYWERNTDPVMSFDRDERYKANEVACTLNRVDGGR